MRITDIVLVLLAGLLFWALSAKCCIYTALALFLVLSVAGGNPLICVGEVAGTDHYHAWVRYGDSNIEQSTLNLYHSGSVDYDNPDFLFTNPNDFVEAVDMLSPTR